jgi:hypothetical protein
MNELPQLASLYAYDGNDHVREWARWSDWSGSLEMVAHIARTAEQALAHPRYATIGKHGTTSLSSLPSTGTSSNDIGLQTRLTVVVRQDAETFDSPDALLHSLTPEACASFDRIDIAVSFNQIFSYVTFVRKSAHHNGVELAVSCLNPARSDDVVVAACVIAACIERGFRRQVGSTTGSENITRHYRGRTTLISRFVMALAPWVTGFCVGLTLLVCIDVLFPDRHFPEAFYLAVVLLITGSYGFAWSYWVPPVELAQGGRTRLRSLLTRTLAAAVLLIFTTVAKTLIHAG